MGDQAHTLRRLAATDKRHMPGVRVFSVTSGKGGVGKTSLVVNMAVLLASRGKRVLVLDADLGLANVDIVLGLAPHYNIKHVLDGECSIEDILLEGPRGIKIIPASSGIQELTDLTREQELSLVNALDYFNQEIDYMLIDTGAGISSNVMYFNSASQNIIVVVTPEPTSITDAYAMIKILRRKYGIKRLGLVINSVSSAKEGEEVALKLGTVCESFLGDVVLDMLGSIPFDGGISECIRKQQAFVDMFPEREMTRRLGKIVNKLDGLPVKDGVGHIQFFLKRMVMNQVEGKDDAGYSISQPY